MTVREPLAFRVRPRTLSGVLGQERLVESLSRSVEMKSPFSFVLFGGPGTGKTTIAEAYSRDMGIHFKKLNAVTASKKEMQEAIEESRGFSHAIIIVDEVHRLDKAKQDLLLPYVEDGTFFLIGATTANPYVSLNRAIRSRCRVFEVFPLREDEVCQGLRRAADSREGLQGKWKFSDSALSFIAKLSGGDLRFALNLLEACSIQFPKEQEIDETMVSTIERVPNYAMDKDEEEHYDSVSALQKSIRGSDVDAALYYLARLCIAEDLDSVKRRLPIIAYEDVGLANPAAVDRCHKAIEVAEKAGFPEAVIPLAFTVCELALSPKSRAAVDSIHQTMDFAREKPFLVQDYLKLTPVSLSEEEKYDYGRPDIWEKIQYLPELLKDRRFFQENLQTRSNYEKALNSERERLLKQGRTSDLASLKKSRNGK